jgi:hypothetical protein
LTVWYQSGEKKARRGFGLESTPESDRCSCDLLPAAADLRTFDFKVRAVCVLRALAPFRTWQETKTALTRKTYFETVGWRFRRSRRMLFAKKN